MCNVCMFFCGPTSISFAFIELSCCMWFWEATGMVNRFRPFKDSYGVVVGVELGVVVNVGLNISKGSTFSSSRGISCFSISS